MHSSGLGRLSVPWRSRWTLLRITTAPRYASSGSSCGTVSRSGEHSPAPAPSRFVSTDVAVETPVLLGPFWLTISVNQSTFCCSESICIAIE